LPARDGASNSSKNPLFVVATALVPSRNIVEDGWVDLVLDIIFMLGGDDCPVKTGFRND